MFKGEINRAGRPKGSPNKTTESVRQAFKLLIENNIDKMQNDLDRLSPKERLKVLIELSKFILPTLKAQELKTDFDKEVNIPVISFFKTVEE